MPIDLTDYTGIWSATTAAGEVVTPLVIVPASGVAGASDTRYIVYVNDAFGNRLENVTDYMSLSVAQAVGAVGSTVIALPGYYPLESFKKDGLLEIWRVPQNGQPYLLFNKIFFLRRRQFFISGNQSWWVLTGYDPNFIFGDPSGRRGRIVTGFADTAYTSKTDEADNIIKAIAREQAGSLAVDTARDLSAYLSIQDDLSLAPSISKGFSWRNLLTVFNEICQASITAGTYLAWDVVCSTPPDGQGNVALELRTYTEQRGIDHRASSDSPVLIGTDFGNLDDVEIDDDWGKETSYAYVGGQGEGPLRALSEGGDTARIAESPFNRREQFVDKSNTFDLTALAAERDAALRAGEPRAVFSGRVIQTDQARFDVEWAFGDYVTAQARGRSFDARIDTLLIRFDRDNGEQISAFLKGDE